MRSLRSVSVAFGLLYCLCSLGSAAPVLAQSGPKVAVLPLSDSGVGESQAAEITQGLRAELKSLIGPRLLSGGGTQPCALENLSACAGQRGKALGADLVLAGTVAALADAQLIDLRLFDVAARSEMNRLQSPLTGEVAADRATLRELAVRLVTPENYLGTLEFSTVADGDTILVDGAELGVASGTPVSMAVGPHVVELLRGGQTLASQVVTVNFGQSTAVDFSAAVKNSGSSADAHVVTAEPGDVGVAGDVGDDAGKGSQMDGEKSDSSAEQNWPLWISAGVGGVALLSAVGLTVYYFAAIQPQLDYYSRDRYRDASFSGESEVNILQFYQDKALMTQIGIAVAAVLTVSSGAAAAVFSLGGEGSEAAPAGQ